MPSIELWAGALSLVLLHTETGCPHSALNAARLLDQLSDSEGLDDETRGLCERASRRLSEKESRHACPLKDRSPRERDAALADPQAGAAGRPKN